MKKEGSSLKWIGLIALVAVLVWIDQFTKYLAVLHLKGSASVPVIPGIFCLEYLENRGSAFGMMQGKQIFLLAVTMVLLILLLYFYYKIPNTKHFLPMRILMVFVFAGAVGNMIDRIRFNYVVDFFSFELIHFPIFNVADIYITVSCVIFLLLFLFYYKEEDLNRIFQKK